MNPVTTQRKRELLEAYAREIGPPVAREESPSAWYTNMGLAHLELGELLRPYAQQPHDIPDALIDRAWSLYQTAKGVGPDLLRLPIDVIVLDLQAPQRDVTIGGVTFSAREIESLLMAFDQPSHNSDLSDPLAFHQAMTAKEDIVVDAGMPHEVWNSTAKLSAPRAFTGERPTEGVRGPVGKGELVEYTVTPRDRPIHAGADYVAPEWKYWLELNPHGQPVNGDWFGGPDFMWSPGHDELSIRLYQESISPSGTGEASWWGSMNEWAALSTGLPQSAFTGARFDTPNIRVERPTAEEQIKSAFSGLTAIADRDTSYLGITDLTVNISEVSKPKQDGYAGPAGDGQLSKLEFSWREKGETIKGALWIEMKGEQVVNGGWLSKVPEQLDREFWVLG